MLTVLTMPDAGIEEAGNTLVNSQFFDTLTVKPRVHADAIRQLATNKEINLRYFPDGTVGNLSIAVGSLKTQDVKMADGQSNEG